MRSRISSILARRLLTFRCTRIKPFFRVIEENTSQSFLDGAKVQLKMFGVVSVSDRLGLYMKSDRGVLLTFVKLKSIYVC